MSKLKTHLVSATVGLAAASFAASANATVYDLTAPTTGVVPYTSGEIVTFDYTIPTHDSYIFSDVLSIMLSLGGETVVVPISGIQTGCSGVTSTTIGPSSSPFGDGNISYDLSVSGIAEPASWALMIIGVGGVGALMRRRRAPVAAA